MRDDAKETLWERLARHWLDGATPARAPEETMKAPS
jgi:hypothetical protein